MPLPDFRPLNPDGQIRAEELQVAIDVELWTCRVHATRAGLKDEFQWATTRLARRLEARAEWKVARGMLEGIPDGERNGDVWHNLASIDLREGNYPAARVGFGKALAINQAIGDKAGEAATWHQLGFIAWASGGKAEAPKLVAVSLLILQAIGAAETAKVARNLSGMCGELNYSQEQFDEMTGLVVDAYEQDGGAELLKAAFSSMNQR